MRRLIGFSCENQTLVGTIDEAAGSTGLLIVSGGNEIRSGAHRGMALLAARAAAELGAPVLRYDRRGVGDSTGVNSGYEGSGPDIAAAAATFRAEVPRLTRILAFGNCDAATALALFHEHAGIDALLLANPWVAEEHDALPPAAAIRARYAERVKDPRQWARLFRGGVNFSKLFRGLSKITETRSQHGTDVSERLATAMSDAEIPVTILTATRDNTAVAFREAWETPTFAPARERAKINARDTASHSFAGEEDKAWLFAQINQALSDLNRR
ncbi:MAG: hydrolase 1, exosortase A system-associated [Sphingomonas sp.]